MVRQTAIPSSTTRAMMAREEARQRKEELKRRKAEIAMENAKKRGKLIVCLHFQHFILNLIAYIFIFFIARQTFQSEIDEPVASTSTLTPPSTPVASQKKVSVS